MESSSVMLYRSRLVDGPMHEEMRPVDDSMINCSHLTDVIG